MTQSNKYYHLYKPLRNLSCDYDVKDTIEHCWLYSQYFLHNKNLPYKYLWLSKIKFSAMGIPPWELMVLLREVVINSNGNKTKSINNQAELANIINQIKSLDEKISSPNVNNVLLQLHRIAHLQFPWQRYTSLNLLIRYLKIYDSEALSNHLSENLGLDATKLMILGLFLKNHFQNSPQINLNSLVNSYPYCKEAIYSFLEKITIELHDLKSKLKESQQYDDKWMYTWNQMELTPLITLKKNDLSSVYCPFPDLLHKRITEGIYFDIVGKDVEFGKSFGMAFQKYVGDVLETIFKKPTFEVTHESEFNIGKIIYHGIDWILSDDTANIFIECKTKRLRLNSKIDLESESLFKDLEILSEAIFQTYKNIDIALKGKSNWENNGNQIYPIIITLEDWLLISPPLRANVNERVKLKLLNSKLPEDYLTTMPFTLTSINSFEIACNSILENGIQKFMDLKVQGEYQAWDMKEFSIQVMPAKVEKTSCIFPEVLQIFKDEAKKLISID